MSRRRSLGLVRYNIQNWIAGAEILEGRITGSPHGVSTLRPDLGPPVTHRLATRPPLAGPYAFSRIPPPVWNKPRVFLMHDILNTWLFANFSSGYLFRIFHFISFINLGMPLYLVRVRTGRARAHEYSRHKFSVSALVDVIITVNVTT